ncbi:peptidyl-prolyl cis-trans isomerase C [Pseudomonas sp. ok272]|uniref:peptidylprolyl isomerase n=1 Tax=unclassified Pseudomonas TaxID=196821 RepID=UPI0008D3395B|nr:MULTISPECIES: peptidylprolyl isomerase [unclassified Pseudomonas]SEN26264.1 peptidyl-prolyl cis-trans isomerase C [Pseudomonas sp. ok272]SFN17060.1 peptidyl-prolyl cis-trans isomerase C [Pseudomonas sp. ok602]
MKLNHWLMLLTLWVPVAWCGNEPAVARVNGEEISAFRLERYFAEYLEDQGRSVGSIRNPKAYQQLRRKALDALIDKELLWQEAVKRGVVISDAAVSAQVEQTRQAMGGAQVFARRLNDAGFDEASFTEYTRRELAALQVYSELTMVAAPNDQQVRAFYEEHRAEMNQPEQVQARHILIKVTQDADAATVEAARLRLLAIRREITQGADFANVATNRSEDASASTGGYLGYFPKGRMLPEFDAAAFAMAPGDISQPVRTTVGWHLIYLQNRMEGANVTEEQGFAMVRTYLARQQQTQARNQALAQLRSRNRIERIDDD